MLYNSKNGNDNIFLTYLKKFPKIGFGRNKFIFNVLFEFFFAFLQRKEIIIVHHTVVEESDL